MKENTDGARLLAGAARTDLTPAMGTQLDGDIGRYRPVEEIRERLWANALVLESNGKRVGILSLEIMLVTDFWAARIREGAARRAGIKPADLMIHAIQNHAAPSIGDSACTPEFNLFPAEYPWLRGGHPAYNEPAVEACVLALEKAAEKLEPATLCMGRRTEGRVSFIRRFLMRNGPVKTHPRRCDPDIICAEGVIDPEVSVATFTSASGRRVAALLHFTCHPTHGYPERYVIGDWPGVWAELFKKSVGDECVPLVLNGACGNIHHTNHLDPHQKDDHRAMAEKLMETTEAILKDMAPFRGIPLNTARKNLKLALRKLTREQIAESRRLLETNPRPVWQDKEKTQVEWDWVYAASRIDLEELRRRSPVQSCEVQAIRIGDLGIVALKGEPFVETQLDIKAKSTAPFTMVAHMCNGSEGYIPTRRALEGGGYETRAALWSRLEPAALEKITRASNSLLSDLFRDGR